MSNLAKKLQQGTQQYSQQQTVISPQPAAPKRQSWLTPGEKILTLALGILFTIGAGFLLANQADIYKVNKEIQLVESSIQEQEKVNSDLEMQISELSRYERIKEQAKKLGLTFDENNIKVVQGQ